MRRSWMAALSLLLLGSTGVAETGPPPAATATAPPATIATGAPRPARPVLRICADPNNLPFSNQRGQGFENKIAERLSQALGADLQYTWWAQRRGFLRNTLKAHACDVVMGVPSALDSVAHTRPYYRSTYVFVTRPGRPAIRSFDDPRLRRLRVGVPLIGDDGANPPPEHALARRGIVDNVVGYGVYGDYAQANPPLDLLNALQRGEVDVAAVWGPLAGYFARSQRLPLTITPVAPDHDDGVPLVFDITVGVRRGNGDIALRDRLDRALQEQRTDIQRILDGYGIPRL
jgi:mxaJ protein